MRSWHPDTQKPVVDRYCSLAARYALPSGFGRPRGTTAVIDLLVGWATRTLLTNRPPAVVIRISNRPSRKKTSPTKFAGPESLLLKRKRIRFSPETSRREALHVSHVTNFRCRGAVASCFVATSRLRSSGPRALSGSSMVAAPTGEARARTNAAASARVAGRARRRVTRSIRKEPYATELPAGTTVRRIP